MSKRTITRWYVGAWVVWLPALLALGLMLRNLPASGAWTLAMTAAMLLMIVAGLLTSVMWGVALVRLASQQATALFIAVLVLQIVGLGIVGMVLYALAGDEEEADYVIWPSMT